MIGDMTNVNMLGYMTPVLDHLNLSITNSTLKCVNILTIMPVRQSTGWIHVSVIEPREITSI